MKSLANAVRAKTARACDNCSKKQAHWFCAADDAFLCQSCDTSVHSANALARRHDRVRLKNSTSPLQEAATWHQWFTRKPRTPRGSGGKRNNNSPTFHGLVPEISAEDQTDSSDVEEQLMICQVPVVDPTVVEPKIKVPMMRSDDQEVDKDNAESCLNGFLPTDMELEDFAADVETLLGRGLDTEYYTMEELGLSNTEMFKVKKDNDRDGTTMPFDLNFGFYSQNTYEEDAIKNVESSGECVEVKEEEQKNVLMLNLDYDLVISTWGGQGLPWTSGGPPDIGITGSPAVSMVGNGGGSHKKRNVGGCLPSSGVGDGGREASVSRYREKRRKRLFTKKIRYEVRKQYAEIRPRMKGRFVKRSSLAVSAGNSP
ncbi:Zinc finger protein CONSTANS-LIKE 16 [Raphanus sativus]|uniref:Zinc finger protein CONSTANS-LIKE 16-like n=1 Tax=Raphanus sativus TaxID=3726 RepID=A0A9W3C9I3_RAPSA|nr:zinc finger protein CONSTANS-LIKE 16-like [Raphanus sativus]KAJ4879781.1 Zinc finger protein CONSTANS-LIKE 16 [Raphanus sativus]